ncbi:MAG: PilZ domain-containing protein [Nitrospinae bacterium]|nr:PilZ domain-containing protein [Nitrospinota bacterium]
MEQKSGGGKDNRLFFRFEYPAPVRYRFAKKTEPGKYMVSPWFKGVGVDFSGGGGALNIGKPLPAKTLVLMEIKFPYSDDPVIATAEVVRRIDVEYKGAKVSQISFKYLLINSNVQDRMISFIISRGKSTL